MAERKKRKTEVIVPDHKQPSQTAVADLCARLLSSHDAESDYSLSISGAELPASVREAVATGAAALQVRHFPVCHLMPQLTLYSALNNEVCVSLHAECC